MGDLGGVERTAGEEAAVEFEGGDFAPSVVDPHDQIFGVGRFVDVNFIEGDVSLHQKAAGATAVVAPVS